MLSLRLFVTPLISHVVSDDECGEANCCTVTKHINIAGPIFLGNL